MRMSAFGRDGSEELWLVLSYVTSLHHVALREIDYGRMVPRRLAAASDRWFCCRRGCRLFPAAMARKEAELAFLFAGKVSVERAWVIDRVDGWARSERLERAGS
jgi:hypothetical protein